MTMLLFVLVAKAQSPTFDDLLILFADGNYPKLIKETTKYADKEDSKNDPVVYYWMAKGYYKISFIADRDEDYKNAFKDCFTAASKCIKKDKSGKFVEEHAEFFSEIKTTLVETIRNEVDAKDYRKAFGWITKVYKIAPEDVGAKYLEGACKYRASDKGGANASWKEAGKLLEKITTIEKYNPEDKLLLKMGILETAEAYVAMRQVDKAKELLGKVAQWYEGDESFKARYDEIVN